MIPLPLSSDGTFHGYESSHQSMIRGYSAVLQYCKVNQQNTSDDFQVRHKWSRMHADSLHDSNSLFSISAFLLQFRWEASFQLKASPPPRISHTLRSFVRSFSTVMVDDHCPGSIIRRSGAVVTFRVVPTRPYPSLGRLLLVSEYQVNSVSRCPFYSRFTQSPTWLA